MVSRTRVSDDETTGGEPPPREHPGTCGGRSNIPPENTMAETEALSVLAAAESGDYRAVVVALCDHIARQIDDGCAARDLVGLSRRLIDLAAELRGLDAVEKSGESHIRLVDAPFDPAVI